MAVTFTVQLHKYSRWREFPGEHEIEQKMLPETRLNVRRLSMGCSR